MNGTFVIPTGMNTMNQQEMDRYVYDDLLFYGCRLMQMSAITSLISTWTIRSNHNMSSGLISMLCIRRIIWILRILSTLFARSLFLSRNIKSSWSGSIIWLLDMKREMSSRTQRILFCYRKKSYMKDIKLILMKNYKSIFIFVLLLNKNNTHNTLF